MAVTALLKAAPSVVDPSDSTNVLAVKKWGWWWLNHEQARAILSIIQASKGAITPEALRAQAVAIFRVLYVPDTAHQQLAEHRLRTLAAKLEQYLDDPVSDQGDLVEVLRLGTSASNGT